MFHMAQKLTHLDNLSSSAPRGDILEQNDVVTYDRVRVIYALTTGSPGFLFGENKLSKKETGDLA